MSATPLTLASFKTDVIESETPTLVDFWAPWCGPCRMQGPVVDDVAAKAGERFQVTKVNLDENPELAQLLEIRSIPTLIIFHQGKIVDRMVGLQSAEKLYSALESVEKASA